MNIPFVDLKKQYESIKDEIDHAIAEVISKTAFIGGSFAKSFESAFAEFCNVKHCVGVGNGTDALFIALKALGIGKGDEVITVANSFIATSEAVTMTGAKVVFVPCHNCIDQIRDLSNEYDLGIKAVHFKEVINELMEIPVEMIPEEEGE